MSLLPPYTMCESHVIMTTNDANEKWHQHVFNAPSNQLLIFIQN